MKELTELTEEKLYELLRDNSYEDLVRVTADEYSANDCWSAEYGVYVELKCRRSHYPTLMLEKLKYDRLVEESAKLGMTPLYICSTPQGIWQFDLDMIKLTWEEMDNLPATTEFDNQDKVTKTVAMIPLELGNPILVWYPEYKSEDEFINEKLAADFAFDDVSELIQEGELDYDMWEAEMLADNVGWEDLG